MPAATTESSEQHEDVPLKETPKETEPTSVQDHGVTDAQLYARLCEKLLDRNVELGECFQKYIRFERFQDRVLTLNSSAKDESAKILKHNSAIIRHFVQDVFGFESQIKIVKTDAPATQIAAPAPLTESLTMLEDLPLEDDSNYSMIENTTFEGAPQSESCATGAMMSMQKELDATEILNTPFVQKATDLLWHKKFKFVKKFNHGKNTYHQHGRNV